MSSRFHLSLSRSVIGISGPLLQLFESRRCFILQTQATQPWRVHWGQKLYRVMRRSVSIAQQQSDHRDRGCATRLDLRRTVLSARAVSSPARTLEIERV